MSLKKTIDEMFGDWDKLDRWVLVLGVCFLVIVGIVFFVQPYYEARAFNKFSDTPATYWDAMFSRLRVVPD